VLHVLGLALLLTASTAQVVLLVVTQVTGAMP